MAAYVTAYARAIWQAGFPCRSRLGSFVRSLESVKVQITAFVIVSFYSFDFCIYFLWEMLRNVLYAVLDIVETRLNMRGIFNGYLCAAPPKQG